MAAQGTDRRCTGRFSSDQRVASLIDGSIVMYYWHRCWDSSTSSVYADGRSFMKLKWIMAVLLIAAAPRWAQAQSAVTNEDAQEVIGIISGDKDKTQAYCDSLKLDDQIDKDNQQGKNTEELNRQMNELTEKLGPEYGALMAAYRDMDLSSREGLETGAVVQQTVDKLIALCGPAARRSGRE
jgi:hypothetical protein